MSLTMNSRLVVRLTEVVELNIKEFLFLYFIFLLFYIYFKYMKERQCSSFIVEIGDNAGSAYTSSKSKSSQFSSAVCLPFMIVPN